MGQRVYEIRVEGHLEESWSPWLGGMSLRHEQNGQTILTGPLPDEPALHGVLAKIRDLGLPLVQVRRSEAKSGIIEMEEGGKT